MEVVKASLDRFEGNYAVVYSDDGKKFDVPKDMIGAKAGSRIRLYIEGSKIFRVEVDSKATDEALDKVRKKYGRLKRGDHLL
ncbi:protein of unknown function DUF3006 [Candidatus Nitrososphaera gargensis Ga9.2]|uniref:DUF3006 domain-containing protein n=1 Tax=Nitrososphaera gargensis (strain Ga9.2) TaxID=1237085 RepID=K0I9G6_NITGG|nr:DUF3006 domain-containing protein [Candidatus Nitrososphaera gargensis]AFU57996.1 protein of unknown function DUF3006 [Candidatus Nitrososphaera gargensis Ga9.2]